MYCGGAIIIRQAVQLASGVNVANLMLLARAAAAANNKQEAYDYYTKALECDSRNAEAWLGKGEAAGWMSTVAQSRIQEMVSACTNAVNFASEAEAPEWCQRCGETITNVCSACYSISRSHLKQFHIVPGTWSHHVQNCATIHAALCTWLDFYPHNRPALELLICICADTVSDRIPYEPFFGVVVSSEHEADLMAKIDEAAAQIACFDPSYVKPKNLTLKALRAADR